jgi:RecB family endonuclease NucS
MCRDEADDWVAIEIKRTAGLEAVEQLSRYLERIQLDPAMARCRGVIAAGAIRPQARTLAESRGIACVEVDIDVLRGEREPELTLFAA